MLFCLSTILFVTFDDNVSSSMIQKTFCIVVVYRIDSDSKNCRVFLLQVCFYIKNACKQSKKFVKSPE